MPEEELVEVSWSELSLTWHSDDFLDDEFTIAEVTSAIKSLKEGKAAGIDAWPNQLIKQMTPNLAECMTHLINACYQISWYPPEWQIGKLIPIYKGKGPKSDPNNYRGISLLPAFHKVISKLIEQRLRLWAEMNDRLPPQQAGFRKGGSTISQALILDTLLSKYAREKGNPLYSIFIDFQKAFDSVSWPLLWQKLGHFGVSIKCLNFLRSMNSNTQYCVQTSPGMRTEFFPSNIGVKQGCILSPLLFILFLADLPGKILLENSHSPKLAGWDIHCLLYADDLALFSLTPIGMQRLLLALESYAEINHLMVNTSKTKAMLFAKAPQRVSKPVLTYRKIPIEWIRSFPYLGIVMDDTLRWNKHLQARSLKAKTAITTISYTLRKIPELDISNCLHLYTAIVSAVMLYGTEITHDVDMDIHDNLAAVFLRKACGLPPLSPLLYYYIYSLLHL